MRLYSRRESGGGSGLAQGGRVLARLQVDIQPRPGRDLLFRADVADGAVHLDDVFHGRLGRGVAPIRRALRVPRNDECLGHVSLDVVAQRLPELFRDEGHDGVEEAQAMVEDVRQH